VKAQASGAAADTDEWDPQLEALAAEYSPAMVVTAFAVKEGLEEDGYEPVNGIGFMETARRYMKKYGPMLVKNKVKKQMNRELRAAGLK
jgi:hypothetical protein